jgi:hypothetical protein
MVPHLSKSADVKNVQVGAPVNLPLFSFRKTTLSSTGLLIQSRTSVARTAARSLPWHEANFARSRMGRVWLEQANPPVKTTSVPTSLSYIARLVHRQRPPENVGEWCRETSHPRVPGFQTSSQPKWRTAGESSDEGTPARGKV